MLTAYVNTHKMNITMTSEFASHVELGGNFSLDCSNRMVLHENTESGNMTCWTPEKDLYLNISYRFKTLMSQPHQLIALILGFMAISSNLLSILALRQCQCNCYFKLLMSLSSSDILIGCTLVLHKLSKVFIPAYRVGMGSPAARLRSRCVFMVIKAFNNTALNSSLLNLMAMALHHYLAILRPLHYHMLLTHKRTHLLIILLWLVALILGFSDFLSAIGMTRQNEAGLELNYCEVVWMTSYQEEFCTFGLTAVCLCILCCIYLRIYLVVCKQQQRESHRNKKALCTTLLVLSFFILCWLPNCLFQLSMFIQVRLHPNMLHHMSDSLYHADKYLTLLLFFNAIADPLIYVCRLTEIRQGYVSVISCCCKNFFKYPTRLRQSEDIALQAMVTQHRKSLDNSHKTDKSSDRICPTVLDQSISATSLVSSHSRNSPPQSRHHADKPSNIKCPTTLYASEMEHSKFMLNGKNSSSQVNQLSDKPFEVPLLQRDISTDSDLEKVMQTKYVNGHTHINVPTVIITDKHASFV